jgi:apolipoprotein N-acyltransferase
MIRTLFAFAAWATFGLICFVTLSPIGLRPEIGSPGPERFLAFVLLGGLLVIAYPNRFGRLAIFIVIVALGLEALQQITPDRHGHLADTIVKVVGGWAGCSVAWLGQIVIEKRFLS